MRLVATLSVVLACPLTGASGHVLGMGAALDRPALKLRTLLMVAEDSDLMPAMDAIRAAAAAGRRTICASWRTS
jgi:hypothetical protein